MKEEAERQALTAQMKQDLQAEVAAIEYGEMVLLVRVRPELDSDKSFLCHILGAPAQWEAHGGAVLDHLALAIAGFISGVGMTTLRGGALQPMSLDEVGQVLEAIGEKAARRQAGDEVEQ